MNYPKGFHNFISNYLINYKLRNFWSKFKFLPLYHPKGWCSFQKYWI